MDGKDSSGPEQGGARGVPQQQPAVNAHFGALFLGLVRPKARHETVNVSEPMEFEVVSSGSKSWWTPAVATFLHTAAAGRETQGRHPGLVKG
jgi:hypothetical protein